MGIKIVRTKLTGKGKSEPPPSPDFSSINFVALDFETADYSRDSACSVGLVRVENGKITARRHSLLRPPRSRFEFTHIHGITWPMVANQPTFAEFFPMMTDFWKDATFLAAHNIAFERSVLRACCLSAGLSMPTLPFKCSMALARSVLKLRSCKLPDVCAHLKLPLKHHNALSDAEACAGILLATAQL